MSQYPYSTSPSSYGDSDNPSTPPLQRSEPTGVPQGYDGFPTQSTQARQSRGSKKLAAVTGITGLLLGVAAGGLSGYAAGEQHGTSATEARFAEAQASEDAARRAVFQRAIDNCGERQGAELGDGGTSLYLDTKGEDFKDTGMSMRELACYMTALEVPDSVIHQMEHTRALDGTREAHWNGIAASWNYHPDDGMSMTLTLEE